VHLPPEIFSPNQEPLAEQTLPNAGPQIDIYSFGMLILILQNTSIVSLTDSISNWGREAISKAPQLRPSLAELIQLFDEVPKEYKELCETFDHHIGSLAETLETMQAHDQQVIYIVYYLFF
jgi:hypothetical protein